MREKLLVGALEKVCLKELELTGLTARIDTGAQTSSLHASNIQELQKQGQAWVEFDCILDDQSSLHISCPIQGERKVKSSNGTSEKRIVIESPISLGEYCWSVKLTLTDRSSMSYPMLLGREAMQGRIIVDPDLEFLVSS